MGNSLDIHFGETRPDEPPEYSELKAALAKYDSEEELLLVAKVRSQLKPEWIKSNKSLCNFISLACLRFRRYDVDRAVKRMTSYFEWRIANLPEGLLEQDISEGSLLDRLFKINMAKLLPCITIRGQSIVYLRLCKARPDLFQASDICQMVHFIMLSALKRNRISQTMGIITMGDLEGAGLAQLDRNLPKKIIGMISKNIPIRLAGMLICHPNMLVSIIVPLAKLFMTTKMKERLKTVGDDDELTNYYGIKKQVLPQQLGGEFKILEDGNPLCSIGVEK